MNLRIVAWLVLGLMPAVVIARTDSANATDNDRSGPSQSTLNGADRAKADDALTTLSGQLDLARLVDLAAQRLKLNIEYDAGALRAASGGGGGAGGGAGGGGVTLRMESALSDQELWQLVNRVLLVRGFTTVRMPGDAAYAVVRLQDAPALAGTTLQLDTAAAPPESPAPGYLMMVVRAKHRSAKDLIEQVNKVMSRMSGGSGGGGGAGGGSGSSGGPLSVIGDTGLMLISDVQPRVDRAMELIALLDSPTSKTVVREVALKSMGAASMAALLTQVNTKQEAVSGEKLIGDVLAAPDGVSLMVLAPEEKQTQWKSLIESLDRREEVVTRTYAPRYFSAAEVAGLIEQTVRDGGGGAGVGRRGSTIGGGSGGGSSAIAVGGAGGAGGADERWRLVIDALTGSLIITATPAQHIEIEDLLRRLDSTPAASRRPVRSFVIKNRSVTEIRQILDELLRAGVLDAANADERSAGGSNSSLSGSLAAGDGAGAASSTFPMPPPLADASSGASAARGGGAAGSPSGAASASSRSSERVVAGDGTSSPSGNSSLRSPLLSSLREEPALASAPPSSWAGGGGAGGAGAVPLIMTVDEGTNTLITIGEPRLLAQIETLLKTLDVRQPQVMLEVLMITLAEDQSLALGAELEQLTISGDVRIRLSSLFGLGTRTGTGDRDGPSNATGLTGVVLSPGDFSVVVRALERMNNGRSVSMPKLLVGNNQQASINSVVQQPFASVNASNTVSTTSFGGTSDAGTVVNIRPQIAEGDHMILDYSVSLSSFTGAASDPTLPPPRQQNQVQSVATIPDGSTVVVGGIEIESQSKSVSQVPLIGSIPVLGEAFKSRSNSTTRSRFYVFIRANILRGRGSSGETSFEDIKYLSAKDAASAKVDDGFPEVRARVIR